MALVQGWASGSWWWSAKLLLCHDGDHQGPCVCHDGDHRSCVEEGKMYTRATGSSIEQAGVRPDRAWSLCLCLCLSSICHVYFSLHTDPNFPVLPAPSPLLTAFPLHFQGLDGAKGEKGASGERGPHGLPVSVVSDLSPRGIACYALRAC